MKHHNSAGKFEMIAPSEAQTRLKEIARVLALKEKSHAEYLVRHAEELAALQKEKAELESVK